MKKLSEILSADILEQNDLLSKNDFLVSDICDDSRKVTKDSLFIAIQGNSNNGKQYIEDAISKGAKYIVSDFSSDNDLLKKHKDVIFISAKNVRHELAFIASRFFDDDLENIVAVTGTNGKSSTVDIVRQIWSSAGKKAVSIGTLGIIFSDGTKKKLPTQLTSPGAIDLHKIFHSLKTTDRQKFSAAIEASSHGISQYRVDCIPFAVCAFTNFTQDHLDYHKTMENYWKAKEKLFSEIASAKTDFVVNMDDPMSEKIVAIAQQNNNRCIGYGYRAKEVKIINVIPMETSQNIVADFFGECIEFCLPLVGKFQTYNSLCAAAICHQTGIKTNDIVTALEKISPINGRLELISTFNDAKIYVDYAHTPDALQNAISSLREHNPSRIITVFGCGGERDRQKRPIMGKIAEKFSDISVVTDDNPRRELPSDIRKMILEGCENKNNVIEVADRKKAIEAAINMLQKGDFLLIAGKGHEDYQQIGTDFISFSDKQVVLEKVSQKS